MEDEKLKRRIGANIAAHRKQAGLTQVGLAEKLNYSDKAVSKWERGESVPDVMTLMAIAETLEVTVNDLIADPNALPENGGVVGKTVGLVMEKTLKRKANKRNILGLASVLVWFVALVIYIALSSSGTPKSWLAFLYAFPADCIVMLILRCAWRDYRKNRLLISGIMWGITVSIFVTLLACFHICFWKLFLLCIPGQAAIILWCQMFRPAKHQERDHEQESAS